MPEVEILTGGKVVETRPLWEEVFVEDTKAFVDYYYSVKAQKNICFVIRQNGQIVAMLHLTPYDICVRKQGDADVTSMTFQEYPTFYIVGVATLEAYRHRGYMTLLLQGAFSYSKENGVTFTFLMPANPAIYEPFGFSYIYERSDYRFCKEILWEDRDVQIRKAEEKDCHMLGSYAMDELSEKYQFFLKRDPVYFQTLIKELESENGSIYLVYVKGQFAGYFTYARETEEFVQEVLIKKKYESRLIVEEHGTKKALLMRYNKMKPIIMAKYLQSNVNIHLCLKEIATGRKKNGFINELV